MNQMEIMDLVKIVHDKDFIDTLNVYIDYRINLHRTGLEYSPDLNDVKFHQGAIDELKKLRNLKASILDKR